MRLEKLMHVAVGRLGNWQGTMLSPRISQKDCLVACGLAAILSIAAPHASGGETTIYEFHGGKHGANPESALVADNSGNLYGTTIIGGTREDVCKFGCGTIFKLTIDGHERVLHAFAGGSDGAQPTGLIRDDSGNFYGTTFSGGGNANCGDGCGTVFELAAGGTETVLYAFQGGSDGWGPEDGLVADQNGNLYGETVYGGNFSGSNCDIDGCGTVFEIKPDGTKLTLHTFQSSDDGDRPLGGLVIDRAGNLYGTSTIGGGSGCGGGGCGAVFKIAPDGTETIFYAFQGGSDGAVPVGLVMDKSGNLYGITEQGGSCSFYNDCGTIYRLAPDDTKTLLYDFKGGTDDGQTPQSALIVDEKGNLYGTTFAGGPGCKKFGGCGTVFELTPNGTETGLYKLTHNQGSNPVGALFLGKHGELYGTAERGGMHNNGAVFEVKK